MSRKRAACSSFSDKEKYARHTVRRNKQNEEYITGEKKKKNQDDTQKNAIRLYMYTRQRGYEEAEVQKKKEKTVVQRNIGQVRRF